MKFTETQLGFLSLIHFHCHNFLTNKHIETYNVNVDYEKLAINRELGLKVLEELHLELESFFTFCDEMTEAEIDVVLKAIYTMSTYILFMGLPESAMINPVEINNEDFIKECEISKEQYPDALHFVHTQIYPKFEDYDVFKCFGEYF